jgi:hypothetical protein
MFRFDIKTKRSVLFKLCRARLENITATFKKTAYIYRIGKKERNIRFFLNESKKRIVFDHKKTKR